MNASYNKTKATAGYLPRVAGGALFILVVSVLTGCFFGGIVSARPILVLRAFECCMILLSVIDVCLSATILALNPGTVCS
jgi:hypothetical protein